MPVQIVKKGASSNEAETLGENTPIKSPPQAQDHSSPKPFIDKISIVLDISEDDDPYAVYGYVFAALADKTVFRPAQGCWGPYRTARRVALSSVADLKKLPLLQYACDPLTKKALGFRTEFSPVDLGPAGLEEYHATLMTLMHDGWLSFLQHGRMTKLEVSVDLPGVQVEAFHALPHQGTTSKAWKTDGKLETMVLGKSGGNQTRVYSRDKKRIAKGQNWTGPPTTRVERILRFQPARPLTSLAQLANPFTHISAVLNVPEPPPGEAKPYIWSLFRDSVNMRGLTAALKLLPVEKRTMYRKWLDQHPTSFWDPAAIWTRWQDHLSDLKMVDQSAWL